MCTFAPVGSRPCINVYKETPLSLQVLQLCAVNPTHPSHLAKPAAPKTVSSCSGRWYTRTHTHCTHAHISLLHTKSHFFCKLSLRVCAVVINKQSDYEQSSFIININVFRILLCKVITSQCTFGNLVSL